MSIFPLFSASVPMIGRTRIFDRMCGDLTKPTPQHLSLVGPRYFGKSVMLEAVAKRMSAEGKFECILIWDLGHQTPQSDSEFLTSLRRRIAAGLKEKQPQFADYLTQAESSYDELREVIESLGKNGQRILMFWDGFDRPLQSGI